MPLVTKFLCCLPLRLGTLVISFGHFVSSGLAAGLLWYVVDQKPNEVSKTLRIFMIVWAAIFTLMAIVSFAGFFGALLKRSKLVRTFSVVLSALLGFQIGIAVVNAILYFHESKDEIYRNCLGRSTDQSTKDMCRNAADHSKSHFVGVFIVPLLFHAYGCLVIRSYATELRNAEQLKANRTMTQGGFEHYKYDPVGGKEQNLPTYPFHGNGYQA